MIRSSFGWRRPTIAALSRHAAEITRRRPRPRIAAIVGVPARLRRFVSGLLLWLAYTVDKRHHEALHRDEETNRAQLRVGEGVVG